MSINRRSPLWMVHNENPIKMDGTPISGNHHMFSCISGIPLCHHNHHSSRPHRGRLQAGCELGCWNKVVGCEANRSVHSWSVEDDLGVNYRIILGLFLGDLRMSLFFGQFGMKHTWSMILGRCDGWLGPTCRWWKTNKTCTTSDGWNMLKLYNGINNDKHG